MSKVTLTTDENKLVGSGGGYHLGSCQHSSGSKALHVIGVMCRLSVFARGSRTTTVVKSGPSASGVWGCT